MKVDSISHYHSELDVSSSGQSETENNISNSELENEHSDVKSTSNPTDGSEVDKDELIGLLDRVNQYAEIQQVNLRLKVDESIDRIIVSVLDQKSGEVIRQIPSEHAIKQAKDIDAALKEFLSPSADRVISLLSDKV